MIRYCRECGRVESTRKIDGTVEHQCRLRRIYFVGSNMELNDSFACTDFMDKEGDHKI